MPLPVHRFFIAFARVALAAGALLLFASQVPEASAKVLIKRLPEQHYTVRGRTHEDIGRALRDNMVRFRPETSELAAGLTYGILDYNFRWHRDAGGYRVADAEVTLTLRYVYPKWVSREYAAPDVVQGWDVLMAHLVIHEEQGHGAIWKESAKALEGGIMSIAPQSSKEALAAKADEAYKSVMNTVVQRNQAFDLLEKNNYAFKPFPWWKDR